MGWVALLLEPGREDGGVIPMAFFTPSSSHMHLHSKPIRDLQTYTETLFTLYVPYLVPKKILTKSLSSSVSQLSISAFIDSSL